MTVSLEARRHVGRNVVKRARQGGPAKVTVPPMSPSRLTVAMLLLCCPNLPRRSGVLALTIPAPCRRGSLVPASSGRDAESRQCTAHPQARFQQATIDAINSVCTGRRASRPALQAASSGWDDYFGGGGSGGSSSSDRKRGDQRPRQQDVSGSRRSTGRHTTTKERAQDRNWTVERPRNTGGGRSRGGRSGRDVGHRTSGSLNRGRGQYADEDGGGHRGRTTAGGRASSARSGYSSGGGRGMGRRASGAGRTRPRSRGTGYNTDDFELVEEGSGPDGTWGDHDSSFSTEDYGKSAGADTIYGSDFGDDFEVVRTVRTGTSRAARGRERAGDNGDSATDDYNKEYEFSPSATLDFDATDWDIADDDGSRRGHRERGRRTASSPRTGGPEAVPRVRDGAALRIKRREERERQEQEQRALFFESLDVAPDDGDREGQCSSDGGGGDSIFGDYFSTERSAANPDLLSVPALGLPPPTAARTSRDSPPLLQDDSPSDRQGPKRRSGNAGAPSRGPKQGRGRSGGAERGGRAGWSAEDRWAATGSTAWMDAAEDEGGQGHTAPGWKVPKAERQEDDRGQSVPRWLPKQGGLGSSDRNNVLPLPEGIDTTVKKLGIKGLEALLKKKFVESRGVVEEAIDYYDPDDEGYEPSVSDREPLVRVDPRARGEGDDEGQDIAAAVDEIAGSGTGARAGADASSGGFRMRSPARVAADAAAAAAAAAAATAPTAEATRPTTEQNLAPETSKPSLTSKRKGEREGGEARAGDADRQGRKTDINAVKRFDRVVSIKDMPTLEPTGATTFGDLGIDDSQLLANIRSLSIEAPTEVQTAAIKGLTSEDRDVIIHAHTGSGKTLAYLLPLIAATDPDNSALQAVIVAPGRELASQIATVCDKLIEGTGLRSSMVIGGANALRQMEKVKKTKPQIVIATPGRLCELAFDRRRLKLGSVRTLVLDEVDALLRPPYDQEIDAIADAIPKGRRQVVFASATGRSPVVVAASERYMRGDPLLVGGGLAASEGGDRGHGQGRAQGLPSNIRHTIVTVQKVKKFATFRRLLNTQPFPESVMIFVNDPLQVNWLTERLEDVGVIAAPLSGESSKDDRAEIMRRLQDKRLAMVVTTEMAARGLDVPHLTHVVNYDLPTDGEHYVHRAGRCGRAGRPGIVVNLVTPETKFVIGKFAKQLGMFFDDCEIREGRLWAASSQQQQQRLQEEQEAKTSTKRPPARTRAHDDGALLGASETAPAWEIGGREQTSSLGETSPMGGGLGAEEPRRETGAAVISATATGVLRTYASRRRGVIAEPEAAPQNLADGTEGMVPVGVLGRNSAESRGFSERAQGRPHEAKDTEERRPQDVQEGAAPSHGNKDGHENDLDMDMPAGRVAIGGRARAPVEEFVRYEVPGGIAISCSAPGDGTGSDREADWDPDDWGDGDWGDYDGTSESAAIE